MPAFTATAPGKIILLGEHAVVYGRPAIAAPVNQVRARAVISAAPRRPSGEVLIQAPDIGLESRLADLPGDHPLACAVNGVFAELGISRPLACTIRITSTIPVASGMGSGAAVSVAFIRALSAFLGQVLSDERVSTLAFEVEKIHHGTPSGIDNTVITYNLPVYFVRGKAIQTLRLSKPFTLVIGDTGVASSTAIAVGEVRRRWQASTAQYEAIFDQVGRTVDFARNAIEVGWLDELGLRMDENHNLLRLMGVSSPELEQLVQAARAAGALGAKLSGGGRGGNMIALATEASAPAIAQALSSSGAVRTITTTIQP